MKKIKFYTRQIMAFSAISAAMLFVACTEDDDDDPTGDDPVASFQYAVDESNFLQVTFSNFSQNATEYSWDFGDGTDPSTEEGPIDYTYAEVGEYTVTLTASNADGVSSTKSETFKLSDPDDALTLLTGLESKTWKLFREGTSMQLDPHWPGLTNDGTRDCLYKHEFIFHRDGTYQFEDNDGFWGEFGIWPSDDPLYETCFEPTAENMVADGVDVSAWGSGMHEYTYDAAGASITINGTGAWIGIPKITTSSDAFTGVQSTVTFSAVLTEETGYDLMLVSFDFGDGGTWKFNYVSYNDWADEPALVSVAADFSAQTNGLEVTFDNNSSGATSFAWDFGDGGSNTEENPVHTYAAEGTYSVTLSVSDASGSSASVTKDVAVSSAVLTESAPAPTHAEADVISIYSDAYAALGSLDINPNWGQTTVTSEIEIVTGDMAVKMEALNYQGIDFGGAKDVSSKTMVHIDVWTAAAETFNFFLIGGGETPKSLTTTGGQWDSFDIPLSDYSSVVDLTATIQFKFDATSTPTIYYDNIYFY